MNNLEQIIKQKKEEIRKEVVPASNAVNTLAKTLEYLPDVLRLKLNPIQKNLYLSKSYNLKIPESVENSRENTEIISLLYGYLSEFIFHGLVPNMLMKEDFKPSDLGKAVKILKDTKEMVHKLYEANNTSQNILFRNKRSFTFSIYLCDKTTDISIPFFENYEAVKKYEYISAFKNVYDSLKESRRFGKLSDKEKRFRVYNSFKLMPDLKFVKKYVLPNLKGSKISLVNELEFSLK